MSKSTDDDKQPILDKAEDGKYKLYKARWFVMICAVIANLSSGMVGIDYI